MSRADPNPPVRRPLSVLAAGVIGAVVAVAGCLGWTGGLL